MTSFSQVPQPFKRLINYNFMSQQLHTNVLRRVGAGKTVFIDTSYMGHHFTLVFYSFGSFCFSCFKHAQVFWRIFMPSGREKYKTEQKNPQIVFIEIDERHFPSSSQSWTRKFSMRWILSSSVISLYGSIWSPKMFNNYLVVERPCIFFICWNRIC